MQAPPLTLYGWQLSYFTGKIRCYLRYKDLAFTEHPTSLWHLLVTMPRRVGAAVMPVLRTPQGQWLQDSSEIIDHFEAQQPQRPVIPPTPLQRCVSHLLEAWLDEWWIPVAMHSRWTYAENYRQRFRPEAGAHLLPHWPRAAQNLAADFVARRLRRMCPLVGIRAHQLKFLQDWSCHALDLLQEHFSHCPYLLGQRPTLADFALAGPMVGHLGRDPWPAREWIAPRPALRDWIDRMIAPAASLPQAPLWPQDEIAPTLQPIVELVLREFTAFATGINDQVLHAAQGRTLPYTLPRGLADVCIDTPQGRFCRRALPYTLWMVQRLQQVHGALESDQRQRVQQAFARWGDARILQLPIPPLQRRALQVALV